MISDAVITDLHLPNTKRINHIVVQFPVHHYTIISLIVNMLRIRSEATKALPRGKGLGGGNVDVVQVQSVTDTKSRARCPAFFVSG